MGGWEYFKSLAHTIFSKEKAGKPETGSGKLPPFDPNCEVWRYMAELLYVRVDVRVIVGEIFNEGAAAESVVFRPNRTGHRRADIPNDRVCRAVRWLLEAKTVPH